MDGVTITLRLETPERDGQRFLVPRVSITNGSRSAIGLYARLGRLEPNEAYIQVDSGVLSIEKNILTPPSGVEAAETFVPYVMVVEPGGSFHERLRYPIPVRSDHPMRALALELSSSEPMEAVADRSVNVSRVRFSIGAFVRTPSVRLAPVGDRHPGVFNLLPPVPSHETLTVEARLPRPVAALDYRLQRPPWAR